MRSRHLFVTMVLFVALVFGYAAVAPDTPGPPPAASTGAAPTAAVGPAPAYDVSHLREPPGQYLGVALAGAPRDMGKVDGFADLTGHRPNMITIYESFDDEFAAAEIRKIFQYGALPILRWEPYKAKLADIAAGRHDPYIRRFAAEVRRVNLPIALTIAHEMNGHWYPWGADTNDPADFVAAWRHIHALYAEAGATNVIWTWTPNVVNPVPTVPLEPLYPGDAYVDWIGIDGYFTHSGAKTFEGLFGPTMREVEEFTDRPFLVVETGSEPGAMRERSVRELFEAVRTEPKLLGFVYFNQKGSGDWVIDRDQRALATYRREAARGDRLGFRVR
ncbi:glycoside hydrolase family 26 protein [Polymorphospora lycopeni]|uniref:Glycosyl hydrolase n=1 Tax=Polymorphospora lycopeni TaxID=3140240 RepID=A0ABV5D5U4_9ACTN